MKKEKAHSQLPEQFDAFEYVNTMQSFVGLDLNHATQIETSKLMEVAYNMAKVVYQAPIDNNHIDMANVFKAGPIE